MNLFYKLLLTAMFLCGSFYAQSQLNYRLGTCTHFSQGWDHKKIMPLIQESGLGWIRDDLNWNTVEKKKGEYIIPEKTLQWIRAAHQHNLKLILILNGSNRIYENPYDREAFAAFARAMAIQLKNDVDALEILNEPANFGYSRYYGGTWNGIETDGSLSNWVRPYVELLNKSAEAIKAVNPEMKVLGLSSVPPVNFRQIALGISPVVDGIAEHPYSNKSVAELIPFEATEGMIKRDGIAVADEIGTFSSLIHKYREQSAKYNGPKEIWLTEFGFSSFVPDGPTHFAGYTANAQAKYLLRRMMQCLGLNVDVSMQYDFKNDGDNLYDAEHNFGLIDHQLNPKEAFYAVQRLAKLSEGFRVDQSVKVKVIPKGNDKMEFPFVWKNNVPAEGDAVPAYGFLNKDDRPVIALWSAQRANGDAPPMVAQVELETRNVFSRIRMIDLMNGKESPVSFLRQGAKIIIDKYQLTDYPVLLILDK
jgi:hypothetical protein